MSRHTLPGLLIVVLIVLLTGCGGMRVPTLEREELFTLQYGEMEDQLALFAHGGSLDRTTHMFMDAGLFRISSGDTNKVMEFTSFGDLISLYYDPEENPTPFLMQSSPDPDRVVNRQAFAYPFTAVGDVSVDGNGVLLVEDQVPARVADFDDELGVMLNRVILRFDADGNQLDYLGQEGVGGTYLPYIQRIETTENNEVVVTCTAPPRTLVFWYSATGDLLRRIEITPDTLPVPADIQAVPVLESVYPDRSLRRLYLKVNYHLALRPGEPGSAGAGGMMSRIYWMNARDGSYAGFVDVPRNVGNTDPSGSNGHEVLYPYEFLGAAAGEHLFLLSQESSKESQLLILHTSGRVVRRRTILIDYDEVVYRDLQLSAEGILAALLADRDEVRVVWWRTDRLFDGDNR
jgi:hypothetical protein